MGGEVANHHSLTLKNARNKVFFLSDFTAWRKLKYIMAVALGGPMLHFQWLEELEERHEEAGKTPIFDSSLYAKFR